MSQREVIWALEGANRRAFRAFQLKEELRDILGLSLLKARLALDDWLHYASRSKLAPFVKLARTIRVYRDSIEATIGSPPHDPRHDQLSRFSLLAPEQSVLRGARRQVSDVTSRSKAARRCWIAGADLDP